MALLLVGGCGGDIAESDSSAAAATSLTIYQGRTLGAMEHSSANVKGKCASTWWKRRVGLWDGCLGTKGCRGNNYNGIWCRAADRVGVAFKLKNTARVERVEVSGDSSYCRTAEVQLSADGERWSTKATAGCNKPGKWSKIQVAATGRYVRVLFANRGGVKAKELRLVVANLDSKQPKPKPKLKGCGSSPCTLSERYPGDKGIERDASVLLYDNFDSGLHRDWSWTSWMRNNWELSTVTPRKGGRSLALLLPKKSCRDCSQPSAQLKFAKFRKNVVYVRYYGRFSREWSSVNRLHAGATLRAGTRSSANNRPDGTDWYSTRLEPGSFSKRHPAFVNYTYYVGQNSDYAKSFAQHRGAKLIPKTSRWYCIETMLRTNTMGKSDGRLASWVDGKLIVDKNKLLLRKVAKLVPSQVLLSAYMHGNEHNIGLANTTKRFWIDDVVVATKRIGCRIR